MLYGPAWGNTFLAPLRERSRQKLSGCDMLFLWVQRVFKRADVFEKHVKHFLEPWLCMCVLMYPSLRHCGGSGRAKTAKIKQKWAISQVFSKKSYFGAFKAPEDLGDLKTHLKLPKLSFWWLTIKNLSTYMEKFKVLNTHEMARIWDFPSRFCVDLVRISLTNAVWASLREHIFDFLERTVSTTA